MCVYIYIYIYIIVINIIIVFIFINIIISIINIDVDVDKERIAQNRLRHPQFNELFPEVVLTLLVSCIYIYICIMYYYE